MASLIFGSGKADDYWFTVEQGLHNGTLLAGDLFGIAAGASAIVPSAQ